MEQNWKFYERQLCEIWKQQKFDKPLKTSDGLDVNVLDLGYENEDGSGPDFLNTRISIGNLTYVGDIEVDIEYNNWKTHGHNIDAKYNKLILHICLINKFHQKYVYTRNGRRIPSICLSNFLTDGIVKEYQRTSIAHPKERERPLRCSYIQSKMMFKAKKEFIAKLGIERFKRKCKRIFHRLKELTYLRELKIKEPVINYELTPEFNNREFSSEDFIHKELWEQLLYELVFEALGYSKNKVIMMQLAQAANIDFIKKLGKDDEFLNRVEAALFNISGLLPQNEPEIIGGDSNYKKNLIEDWEIIKRIYDGTTFDETQWHFFKLRPQNFPTIRIAGGSRFVKKIIFDDFISTIVKKVTEIRNLKVLINSIRSLFIIKSEGYWKDHYVFDKAGNGEIKYFVGASRADEILVNVVIPYFYVYFDIFGKEDLSKKVLQLFNIFTQKSENKIVRDVAEGLKMSNFSRRSLFTQGMVELFRNFCSKNKCLECEIGKAVFN